MQRYSEYDEKYQEFGREFFVDFSLEVFNSSFEITENDEENHYREINMMCELFNKFENEYSYEKRYKECIKFSQSLNCGKTLACPSKYSNILTILLSTVLINHYLKF